MAQHRPHVLITDLGLPDGNGLALIEETRLALPGTKIAVISVLGDAATVVAAIRSGASGDVLKDDLPEDFSQFIRDLMAGDATLSPAVARHLVQLLQTDLPEARQVAMTQAALTQAALTQRELQVLEFIAKGLSNTDIGKRLGISTHTVGDHVKAIYRKLEVRNRGAAVFQAINRNLVTR
jgi:DNA-binding NarL/FixJ family response regulator